MANHVIVGAGLGGLYLAIRLINKKVEPKNILIIEKRGENQYTRPGHLLHRQFDLVKKNTEIETPHSDAHHIKELERVMYNHLRGFAVRFISETFIGLQAETTDKPKAVITDKPDGYQGVYPADFVFDCSGKVAFVAEAVNSYEQSIGSSQVFERKSLININPIPHHLTAHVIIPNNSYLLSSFYGKPEAIIPHIQSSSLQRIIDLREKLQVLGWSYEAFPEFYTNQTGRNDKICLYMETPSNLTQEKQKEWIELILDIYSNGKIKSYTELNPSKKYESKARIVRFESEPYVLNKVVHKSNNLPVVIIGFDALKGFDYRLANGIDSGIQCCEYMLEHIKVSDGNIQNIDSEAIERETFAFINGDYKQTIDSALRGRQKAIENAFDRFSQIYKNAATNSFFNAEKKQKYQVTADELAYQSVTIQCSKLEAREQGTVASLEVLNLCLSALLRARSVMAANKTSEHQDVNKKLLFVTSIIHLELCAFNIEEAMKQPANKSDTLRALFIRIQENFERLDGHFAKNLVLNRTKEIVNKIPQQYNRQHQMMRFLLNLFGPNPNVTVITNVNFGGGFKFS